jgi:hypothetical protein
MRAPVSSWKRTFPARRGLLLTGLRAALDNLARKEGYRAAVPA